MGYQFVHLESFARKADDKGRSTDFIFSEACRKPEASVHVANPQPPIVVHGCDIDELQEMHDKAAAIATIEVKGGHVRKLANDKKTLHTVVASHPFSMEEINVDPVKRKVAEEWERLTVAWLRGLYGEDLKCVIRHEDESHYHLHAYVVPISDPALSALKYHPGVTAKREIMSAGPFDGEDKKALGKRADAAYKNAMRQWQDSYHEAVAAPCGLTRLGPQRRRLSRDEWQREQAQARALQKTVERAQTVKEQGQRFIEKTKSEAAVVTAAANEKMEAAKQVSAAANRDRRQAQQEKLQAAAVMADAAQYSRLAGKFRAAWDRFKKSELVQKIRAEFQKEVDHWKDRTRHADEKRLEAERKLHEAERRERAAREEALQAGIERDRLKALLPKSHSSKPIVAVDSSRKLELKPNFRKKEDERQK